MPYGTDDDPGWHQRFLPGAPYTQVWAENTKILMSWWDCGVWAGLTINISCFTQAVLCLPLHHQLHSCINYPKRFLMSIQCKTPGPLSRRPLCPNLTEWLSSQYVSLGKYISCVCLIHFDISSVLCPALPPPWSQCRENMRVIVWSK